MQFSDLPTSTDGMLAQPSVQPQVLPQIELGPY